MTSYTTEDAKIDPKTNPLFQRLFGKEGFLPLNEANLDEFLAAPGLKMAVFAEDPNAKRVTMDIVVIAPELKRAFAGALADARFADLVESRALAARWGLRRFPAVAPWETYCRQLGEIARRTEAPARTIAIAPVSTPSCGD